MSTFDNPAEFAQSTAMFCAALGDYWFDAALTQPLTMRFGVVAAVGVDDFGLLNRSAMYAANRRNGIEDATQRHPTTLV